MKATHRHTSGPQQTGSKLADKSAASSDEKPPKAPKSHTDYWRNKVFKSTKNRDGTIHVSPNYSARISWNGERHSIPLTSNKETAAAKAAEIYRFLQRKGWVAALAQYAPHLVEDQTEKRRGTLTVGEFIREAEKVSGANPRTFREYAQALRRVAAGALAIEPPRRGTVGQAIDSKTGKIVRKGKKRALSPFDYRSPQRREFLAAIDATPLHKLTPAKVARWKKAHVETAASNPQAERSAKHTVNATLRQARSLFSRDKILAFLPDLALPDPLPFDGVKLYGRKETGSMRYVSKVDASDILQRAKEDLAEAEPEPWKILLLALGAGLRRNEIDKLLWRQIDFDGGKIEIAETPYFKPKTADSAGQVEVDQELLALLRGYRARATGEFVIESDRELRQSNLTGRAYNHTRAEERFKTLYAWLRQNGVEGQKPLHTLRKEFGSLICAKAGLYAASRALRHADVAITAQHYLDEKERVTVGLGALLHPENVTDQNASPTTKRKTA